jgi:hypothetical protein
MKISSQIELMNFLVAECPYFLDYWKEVAPIYRVAKPIEAPIEELVSEFARYSLELWQDGEKTKLRGIAEAINSLLRLDSTSARLASEFIKLVAADWKENGADFGEFSKLLSKGIN